jgi:hypothetical protein
MRTINPSILVDTTQRKKKKRKKANNQQKSGENSMQKRTHDYKMTVSENKKKT